MKNGIIYKYRYFHHAVENYLKKTSIINQEKER